MFGLVRALGQTGISAIFCIQCFNAIAGPLEQQIITRLLFLICIGEIRQERKRQILIAVGKESHLHRIDKFIDLMQIGQHRRHCDNGAMGRGNTCREVQSRQGSRFGDQCGKPVDDRKCKLAGSNGNQDT